MQKNSLKRVALNTALASACLSIICAALLFVLFSKIQILLIFPTLFISIFLITYLIFTKALEKHVQDKVRIIYKTIKSFKSSTSDKRPNSIDPSSNVLETVNQEVINWAKSKKKEIDQLHLNAKYRREFLADVSHEIKTPLFSIEGYLHTLIDGGIDDPKINKEYLIKASRNIDRISSMIEDLETISQLESGERTLNSQDFDIKELTQEVFEEQEIFADANDISLVIKDDSKKPIIVNADRQRIRQVITNLISNSIKYSKEDGSGNTTVKFFDMEDNILVEVTDNGIGIAEKDLPRLFERFFRVDKSRSRIKGGTGLGLSIVKHIIEAHDQSINVRSTVDIGTTFGFTLKKA